jgi:hypothetical protein
MEGQHPTAVGTIARFTITTITSKTPRPASAFLQQFGSYSLTLCAFLLLAREKHVLKGRFHTEDGLEFKIILPILTKSFNYVN